jgi:type II restriction/modification system DNA methylase subunit YeeA
VITRPLLAEWAQIRATLTALTGDPAPQRRGRQNQPNLAAAAYRSFIARLRAYRVLDPGCGSGNFLYVALLALKDIEHQVTIEAEAFGFEPEFPHIGPESVLGIEINPYAAELARVTVWIGEIQWMRRNGFDVSRNPILKPLETIECRDAVLNEDGTEAKWPMADVVVGNPPFLGDKGMLGTLGKEYVTKIRTLFSGRLPGGVDLVTYWFEKARAGIAAGDLQRAGLVATQAIRRGSNRTVLDHIAAEAIIFDAWADEPWVVDGAAVRVSLVCFEAKTLGATGLRLDGQPVDVLYADLSSRGVDLTKASQLEENAGCCFQGPVKVGPFDIAGATARDWLLRPLNPNGLSNSEVIRPWINGQDVTGRPSDTWIIGTLAR